MPRPFHFRLTRLASVFALIGVAGYSAAQESSPVLVVESNSADVDPWLATLAYTHRFEVQNAGHSNLELLVTKKSCRCVTHSEKALIVPPNGKGVLEVGYDPEYKGVTFGKNVLSVVVATNDPSQPTVLFTVNMNLVRSVFVNPESLDFGDLDPGAPVRKTFSVTSLIGPIQEVVTDIRTSAPFIKVLLPTEKLQSTTSRDIVVEITPPAGGVGIREAIVLSTNAEDAPLVEIPVQGQVTESVTAEPKLLSFGIVKPGATATRKVLLTVRAGIELGDATCAQAGLSVKLNRKDDSRWELIATFTPVTGEGQAAPVNARIQIESRDGETLLRLPVLARVL